MLPESELAIGVTSLDNHLYVLRDNKTSEQLEVYDKDSYRLLRRLTVPGLGFPRDIVACELNRCAYISDIADNSVHRVTLPDGTVTQWPVNDLPSRLSLTAAHGVLIICQLVRVIKEFSINGQLLHVLTLPEGIVSPLHSIQLSSGEFLVCHGVDGDPVHGVCLMGSDGSEVRSFGGSAGSGSQQMNAPTYMAVDRNGFVFVVDFNNGRVVLLSPRLTYVREVVSRDQLRWGPRRVHLDADRRRLYVADSVVIDENHSVGRVVVVTV